MIAMKMLRRLISTIVLANSVALGFVDYGSVAPKSFRQQIEPASSDLLPWLNTSLTLSPSNPLVILDYGNEVAGFPFFTVTSISGVVQIEVKYTEEYDGLLQPYADGPWTFSNGLANTFRVETFNVTELGYIESFFVQGGQRWQSARLITNGTVTIGHLGFRLTSSNIDADNLPGLLRTGNEVYDRIFDLGGRVAQVACIDAGNAPSTWEITGEGALIRGQASAQSSLGTTASNYTLQFDTKIVRGGVGWRIASGMQPFGPYFVLTTDYPKHNTLANTNRTLLPPNTLVFNSQWSLVNQSTLIVPENQYFVVNTTVKENTWYRLSTTIEDTGYTVRLDDAIIAFVPLPPTPVIPQRFGSQSPYEGTWGFGGMNDHITYYRDVTVTGRNGSIIYTNGMTDEESLAEYQVAPLDQSVCLDGAKRDRLVWAGDFYHTARVVALSTARFDQILGSIVYSLSYQLETGPLAGFVSISANMGSRPQYKDANLQNYAGLVDYQDLFLMAIGEYFHYTGSVEALLPHWGQVKRLAKARLAFIDPTSGLIAGSPEVPSPFSFLGPANGSATTGLFASMLDKIAPVARAIGDEETSNLYSQMADRLREALNRQLWNDQLGTYSNSIADQGNFSLTGIAWAILCGAANATQAASSITKLEELRYAVGYKTNSFDEETEDYQLAPNPSGFLLEALFKARRDLGVDNTTAISHLLDNLWGSMVNNNEYYTGASWEYVKPDGSPGIDLFTSLAHPWGAAPTYVLPEYLLGVAATSPGYKTVTIKPMIGFMDLIEVSGKVPTPHGPIEVSWTHRDSCVNITITMPAGITATLQIPGAWDSDGDYSYATVVQEGKTKLDLDLRETGSSPHNLRSAAI